MPKEQRTLTKACKLEGLRLAETSGKSISEITRDLGVNDSAIQQWEKWKKEGDLKQERGVIGIVSG
ncbi:hypothetical protein [Ktedonospora formicarum]|nr:hypothetical protein [Ktedonospora formicarum]